MLAIPRVGRQEHQPSWACNANVIKHLPTAFSEGLKLLHVWEPADPSNIPPPPPPPPPRSAFSLPLPSVRPNNIDLCPNAVLCLGMI